MELIFATQNQNKVTEVQSKLGEDFDLKSLSDIGWNTDIPETADTLRGNAIIKARTIFKATCLPCFGDDTGLEIDTLEGKPGVYSARFAGEQRSAQDNMNKVLEEMKWSDNRSARFKTCIALIVSGEVFVFEGIVKGQIAEYERGTEGFGYDPIFIPEGYDYSFAQMNLKEKNAISHRALAMDKLIRFLKKLER